MEQIEGERVNKVTSHAAGAQGRNVEPLSNFNIFWHGGHMPSEGALHPVIPKAGVECSKKQKHVFNKQHMTNITECFQMYFIPHISIDNLLL